jgi:hypothetical protein
MLELQAVEARNRVLWGRTSEFTNEHCQLGINLRGVKPAKGSQRVLEMQVMEEKN